MTSPPSQNSPYGGQMSQNLHWNTQFLSFYKNHYIIAVLDSERAGSRTLEKFSRRDRDRDCAKFESSRRFRGSNMNPKKKSRRYRASVSIQALDLAISRFTNSLAPASPVQIIEPRHRESLPSSSALFPASFARCSVSHV